METGNIDNWQYFHTGNIQQERSGEGEVLRAGTDGNIGTLDDLSVGERADLLELALLHLCLKLPQADVLAPEFGAIAEVCELGRELAVFGAERVNRA